MSLLAKAKSRRSAFVAALANGPRSARPAHPFFPVSVEIDRLFGVAAQPRPEPATSEFGQRQACAVRFGGRLTLAA